MKTIKQIADEVGVTKQAIRKHVDKLPPTLVVICANRTIMIKPEGEELLKSWISTKVSTDNGKLVSTNTNQLILSLQHKVEMLELEKNMQGKGLQEQLAILQEELEKKDKEIETILRLLDQEQQLNARNQQKIELLENSKSELLLELAKERELVKMEQNKGFWDKVFKKVRTNDEENV